MLERIEETKILVYGEVRSMVKGVDGQPIKVEYTVDVHCVLKNTSQSIGETVKIITEDPPVRCVSNKAYMADGSKVVIMLQEENGVLRFHNVNVQVAVFNATQENLQTIGKSCSVGETFYGRSCPKKPNECVNDASSFRNANLLKLVLYSIIIALTARIFI